MNRRMVRSAVILAAIPLAIALLMQRPSPTVAAEFDPSLFTKPTIDLGVVVRDLEKSLDFYTNAIGFNPSSAFDVAPDFAKTSGLTSGHPLAIKVLTLGSGPGATQLKLMQVPGGDLPQRDTIHTTYGFAYITLHVSSMDKCMARATAAGAKPLPSNPIEIPGTNGVMLALFKDPDGNFVELVGPK